MTVTIIDHKYRTSETDVQLQNLSRDLQLLGVRSDTVYSSPTSSVASLVKHYDTRNVQNIFVIGDESTFDQILRLFQKRPIQAAIAMVSDASSPTANTTHTTFSANLGLILSQRKTEYRSIGIINDDRFTISAFNLHDQRDANVMIIAPSKLEKANEVPSIMVQRGDRCSLVSSYDHAETEKIGNELNIKKMTVCPYVMRLIVGSRAT